MSPRLKGFADVAATLEKISETKSQLDEVKGTRLAEISRTVDEINREIKSRKSVLAPRVVELRTKRTELQVRGRGGGGKVVILRR